MIDEESQGLSLEECEELLSRELSKPIIRSSPPPRLDLKSTPAVLKLGAVQQKALDKASGLLLLVPAKLA